MPMRGAEVNPSFPYLHFPMYHLKRAADGFTDICQDIPRGRHRAAAGAGNQRRILFRLFRTDLCGNGLCADELDSTLLQRNGRVVKVLSSAAFNDAIQDWFAFVPVKPATCAETKRRRV